MNHGKVERAQAAIKEQNMTLQALSSEYNLTLGQLKNFMSGRLKNVPPEIEAVLVHKMNVSPLWLIEGTGPMLKIEVAHANLRRATNAAIEVLMSYTPISHQLIAEMQEASMNERLDKDQLIERFSDRLPQSGVIQRELTLVDNYRASSIDDRKSIERIAELAAQDAKLNK